MDYGRAPGAKEIPNYEQMMEKMFGPGGKMTIYMAVADEHTVVWGYTSEDLVRRGMKALSAPKQGLAGDEGVAGTAALLPPNAPFVGYWSPKGTVDFVKRMIPAVTPGADVASKVPDFPQTPPIGCAATASGAELRAHLVIPAEVVEALGGYIKEIRAGDSDAASSAEAQ